MFDTIWDIFSVSTHIGPFVWLNLHSCFEYLLGASNSLDGRTSFIILNGADVQLYVSSVMQPLSYANPSTLSVACFRQTGLFCNNHNTITINST